MFKSGQMWERSYPTGNYQIGIILAEENFNNALGYKVFQIAGNVKTACGSDPNGTIVWWQDSKLRKLMSDGKLVRLDT